ncbi:MAG: hypothetical protein IPH86_18750 [bacterium]|nr:hypothetical protein [bacterium]
MVSSPASDQATVREPVVPAYCTRSCTRAGGVWSGCAAAVPTAGAEGVDHAPLP